MYLDFARRTQRCDLCRHSRSREILRFATCIYRFTLSGVSHGHSNGSFKSSPVCPKCIIKLQRPISSTGAYNLFKNFLYLPVGNFNLPICLRMINQALNVFDTISAHEFVKHLICKVASSITDYSSGCPKSAENIFLKKSHNCVAIILGTSYCLNPF